MPTIKKVLQEKSKHKALIFLQNLLDDKQKLTNEDISIILEYFKHLTRSGQVEPILWLIASHGPDNIQLREYALSLVIDNMQLPASEIVDRALPQALTYLLRKLPDPAKHDLIEKISNGAQNHLRFSIVEYLLSEDLILDGVTLMIKMLPTLGTDHDITDAICMLFTEHITPDISASLKSEETKARKSGNNDYTDDIAWALSFANTSSA